MTATICNRSIGKVAVIGSGQIGPDIALHFTKELHDLDIPVVVLDIDAQALDQGRERLQKKADQGASNGIFSDQEAESMVNNVTWSNTPDEIEGADLVIEVAPEEVEVKQTVFEGLEHRCANDAILASSSSHLPPERIFSEMDNPERSLVLHYFYPAERNQLLEIVPGEATDPETVRWCQQFYETIGKAPITVKSRFGYAIDPIFEGIVQTSIMLVEEGVGSERVIDAAVQDVLGRDAGPLTVMNKIGGNTIIEKGLSGFQDEIMSWFRVPDLLDQKIKSGELWDVAGRGETVNYDDETFDTVKQEILGAYFGLANSILASGITNIADLELGLEISMNAYGPFQYMNRLGTDQSLEIVESFADRHEGFEVAEPLKEQGKEGAPWNIPRVTRTDRDHVAVVQIRRWNKRNALNETVFKQLREEFESIKTDDDIKGAVLTGFGRKAFAAGADIGMLSDIESAEEGEEFSRTHHETLRFIEEMDKPVVAALNGLALGGGSEVALGCDERIAKEGENPLIGQPEPNLGLIPGLGGTQRLPRIIGLESAWELLRTAGTLSSEEAREHGLVSELVPADQLQNRAVEVVRKLASEEREAPSLQTDPLEVPNDLPDVDIGHLSKKIDEFLQKAIIEGAETTLEEGIDIEASYFGKCFETDDARIGLRNFIENGPTSKAIFVHR